MSNSNGLHYNHDDSISESDAQSDTFTLARSLRGQGVQEPQLSRLLLKVNAALAVPLPIPTVLSISKFICERYRPGRSSKRRREFALWQQSRALIPPGEDPELFGLKQCLEDFSIHWRKVFNELPTPSAFFDVYEHYCQLQKLPRLPKRTFFCLLKSQGLSRKTNGKRVVDFNTITKKEMEK